MDRRVRIHCVTNPVTMQDVANLILAAGGSAIMAQDPSEVREITKICDVTLINTGVPDDKRWEAVRLAGLQANRLGHPLILDPVGAGASGFRREHIRQLLKELRFTLIRCNQEEAMTLLRLLRGNVAAAGLERYVCEKSGGVDSAVYLDSAGRRELAVELALASGSCVYVSGDVDVVSDGKHCCEISGGDRQIRKITGSGCMLSALCAVFLGEETDVYAACRRAGRLWKECARVAGRDSAGQTRGTGSYRTALLDAVDTARNWSTTTDAGQRIAPENLRVYAVTSENWLEDGEDLTDPVRQLLSAGITCVQLREKDTADEEIVQKAKDLKELCHLYRVPLIINDRPDIALSSGADGVHVGLSDMGVEKARELLGNGFIIGASAHNVKEALAAQRAGADYIGCGAVFGSATKKNVTQLPIDELRNICETVDIPVAAIGGITEENAARLQDTGIQGVAVISALFQKTDREGAVKKFLRLFE